jgi:hypothetical protein
MLIGIESLIVILTFVVGNEIYFLYSTEKLDATDSRMFLLDLPFREVGN